MFSVNQVEKAVDESGLAFVGFESFDELTRVEQTALVECLLGADKDARDDIMGDAGGCVAQACDDLTETLNDDIAHWLSCQ